MQAKTEVFSKLLREIEMEIGSRDLADLVFKSLITAVNSLDVKDVDFFNGEFSKLVKLVSQTEPRYGILNYYFAKLSKFTEQTICPDGKCRVKWKNMFVSEVKTILGHGDKQRLEILKNSEKIDLEGKTILIHDHSHTVQDVLVHNKNMGKHFRVIIAEQNLEKTHDNIERMYGAEIPFQVVPAYMLSHLHDEIDMVFFGAVTMKSTIDFVMAPGDHGIISEFHVVGVPLYMFIDTSKFSLWKSEKKVEVFMHKHERKHCSKPITYERIKYSHDRVPAKLFTQIVTNQGIFDPAGIKKLFLEKMEKYQIEI
ncbi:MAG: hypothetical protein PHP74_03765 [Candidatus Gracilibacteria bacterium]|nr:hypothetical protein [Candidatus Gracilibacteria bacterium]